MLKGETVRATGQSRKLNTAESAWTLVPRTLLLYILEVPHVPFSLYNQFLAIFKLSEFCFDRIKGTLTDYPYNSWFLAHRSQNVNKAIVILFIHYLCTELAFSYLCCG